ncbi:hypothetical protein JTM06_35960, partial [Pseudomonas aeruginosa]|nr:hypothetical protein [Pseudomonas aeruginosa]
NVGSNLIQLVSDIAKRVGIHTITPGGENEIRDLVARGAEKMRVVIADAHLIFDEVRGDYWLTQQFCQSICLKAGVMETCDETMDIKFDIADVRRDVV